MVGATGVALRVGVGTGAVLLVDVVLDTLLLVVVLVVDTLVVEFLPVLSPRPVLLRLVVLPPPLVLLFKAIFSLRLSSTNLRSSGLRIHPQSLPGATARCVQDNPGSMSSLQSAPFHYRFCLCEMQEHFRHAA